jgi:hypothetical protein
MGKIEMRYCVKVSNGASYPADYTYEGTDKDIAIAIASAYIAQGKKVFVYEHDYGNQVHMQFNTAEEAMKEYERDIDIFHTHRPEYKKFAEWLYSKEKEQKNKEGI